MLNFLRQFSVVFMFAIVLGDARPTAYADESPLRKSSSPIVGHRGLIHDAPENTLATFGACIDLRIGFELDLRRSKDGRLVCIHDTTVDRTTDGKGAVRNLTFKQIRQLDAGRWFAPAFAGQRIPTFAEVLTKLKDRRVPSVLIAVDIKADDKEVEADAVRMAEQAGVLDQLLFIGRTISEPSVRKRLRQASRDAHIAVLAQTAADLANAMRDPYADWVYVRFVPTAAQVKTIHQMGKRVFIAGPTVAGKELRNWQSALSAGVDAVLTDYPLVMRRQMRGQ